MMYDRQKRNASLLVTIKRLMVTFDERMDRWAHHWAKEIEESYSRENPPQREG